MSIFISFVTGCTASCIQARNRTSVQSARSASPSGSTSRRVAQEDPREERRGGGGGIDGGDGGGGSGQTETVSFRFQLFQLSPFSVIRPKHFFWPEFGYFGQ